MEAYSRRLVTQKILRSLHSTDSWRHTYSLEAHTGAVESVSFSADDRMLASKSSDDTVILWRTDNWTPIAKLPELSDLEKSSLAFHPTSQHVLATLGTYDSIVRLTQVQKLCWL